MIPNNLESKKKQYFPVKPKTATVFLPNAQGAMMAFQGKPQLPPKNTFEPPQLTSHKVFYCILERS